MRMYVIKRTNKGGGYVAEPGSVEDYTKNLERACKYSSLWAARRQTCTPGEKVVAIDMRGEA